MCTVTYISKGENSFILTTNRDEQAARSPRSLDGEQIGGQNVFFPRDRGAGGTWVAASDNHRVVCVLNGAYDRHDRRPPYRRSRGLMALDFFGFDRASSFFKQYRFEGMEPFTMLLLERGRLWELRWDEKKKHIKELDPGREHIWSSATLYPPEIRNKRQKWFDEWLEEHPYPELNDVLHFHKTGGEGDPWNDIVMNREGMVQTVSITSIVRNTREIELCYRNILQGTASLKKIPYSGDVVGSH
ncbi:MAG: NRDE family protein [Saprospiraceae bacterium]|nr:NRDE family protein [Saprospiraceae bacterium]